MATAREQIHEALSEDEDCAALELELGPGEAIPTDLVALTELTSLRITGPGPLSLPRWFGRMRGLSWLVIEPPLETIPSELARLDTLEQLKLRVAGGFPPVLAELPGLRELGLELDTLGEVPLRLREHRLESVAITTATLTRVPLGLLVLPELSSLTLEIGACPAPPAFPRVVPGLQRLEPLAISGWPLGAIPPVLLQLPALRSLTLRRCGLRELPERFEPRPALEHLDVSANELRELPTSLAEIPALRSLVARDNPLATLAPALAARGLERLDLEDTPVRAQARPALPPSP